MATTVGTLRAVLRLDSGQFNRGLGAAGLGIAGLGRRLDALSKSAGATSLGHVSAGLAGWVKHTNFANVALSGLAAGGLALVGAASLKVAAQFEQAFTGVRKTVDATEAQFDDFRRAILDMSQEIPVTANELAKIGEIAGQLGVGIEDIEVFTRTIAELGVTTNLTLEEGTKQLARFLTIMGESKSAIDPISDALVELGNNVAATESEILDLSIRIAAATRNFGLNSREVLGFSAAFKELGRKPQEAATAIGRAMREIELSIGRGGDQLLGFLDVMQRAGVESIKTGKDLQNAFSNDPAGTFVSFLTGLKAIQDEGGNLSQVLEDLGLGSIRIERNLKALSQSIPDVVRALNLAEKGFQENNARTEEFNKFAATTISRLKILGNTITRLGIDIGTGLLPFVAKAADLLSAVVRVVNMVPGPVKSAAVAFGAFYFALRAIQGLNIGQFLFSILGGLAPMPVKANAVAAALGATGMAANTASGGLRLYGTSASFAAGRTSVLAVSLGVLRGAAKALMGLLARLGPLLLAFTGFNVFSTIKNFGQVTDSIRELNKQRFGDFAKDVDDLNAKLANTAAAMEAARKSGTKFKLMPETTTEAIDSMQAQLFVLKEEAHDLSKMNIGRKVGEGISKFIFGRNDTAIDKMSALKGEIKAVEDNLRLLQAVDDAAFVGLKVGPAAASAELGVFSKHLQTITSDNLPLLQAGIDKFARDPAKFLDFITAWATGGEAAAQAMMASTKSVTTAGEALKEFRTQMGEAQIAAVDAAEAVAFSFEEISFKGQKSFAELEKATLHNIDHLITWNSDLETLVRKGAISLARMFGKLGPEASKEFGASLHELAQMSEGELLKVEDVWSNRLSHLKKDILDAGFFDLLPRNASEKFAVFGMVFQEQIDNLAPLSSDALRGVFAKINLAMEEGKTGFIAQVEGLAGDTVTVFRGMEGDVLSVIKDAAGNFRTLRITAEGEVNNISFAEFIRKLRDAGVDVNELKELLGNLPDVTIDILANDEVSPLLRSIVENAPEFIRVHLQAFIDAKTGGSGGSRGGGGGSSGRRSTPPGEQPHRGRWTPGRAAIGGFVTSNGIAYMALGGRVAASRALQRFGPRSTDTVPAMLTPGEFVMRKEAVDRLGVSFLAALNSGDIHGFHDGGLSSQSFNVGVGVLAGSQSRNTELLRAILATLQGIQARVATTSMTTSLLAIIRTHTATSMQALLEIATRVGGRFKMAEDGSMVHSRFAQGGPVGPRAPRVPSFQMNDFARPAATVHLTQNNTFNVSGDDPKAIAREIRDEIVKLERRSPVLLRGSK